ncbi:MAG: 3-deoxy-D-manno-octulosonic acid transferase [Flavobacteriaceae bacterium]|nr:3-deoxy-D-manno-octulosonic acid transferase [Flavobacteriaceae bacterium]
MHFFYNIIISVAVFLARIVSVFNSKLRLSVKGRKQTIKLIKQKISVSDKVIWFHCASLGEFEQGRPIIEKCKKEYPNHKIAVSFFSPSGYEIRKNYELADIVFYLPFDIKSSIEKFLEALSPNIVIIVKYEFWPNLLKSLKNRNIPTILVSGIFRENQFFFKKYGKWFLESINHFSHLFVQDKESLLLLRKHGIKQATVSGDTRFDRVFEMAKNSPSIEIIEKFKSDNHLIVAGSTWQKDEELLANYINNSFSKNEKIIVAPHNIDLKNINSFRETLEVKSILFSEVNNKDISGFSVLIIDNIGMLNSIYAYANLAYVGGGFTKSGVHNILEPATYGIPIVIGENYSKFKEAIDLTALGGCISVNNTKKLNEIFNKLKDDRFIRAGLGNISKKYVNDKIGATGMVIEYMNDNTF